MGALACWVDRLLTRDRIRLVALCVLASSLAALVLNVVLGAWPRTFIGTTFLPDYLAHWTGGRMLLDGDVAQLYDPAAQHARQTPVTGGAPELAWFVAPPMAALVFAPFAALPFGLSGAVWTVVSIGLLLASMVLLRPMVPRLGDRSWRLVTVALAATQPVLELVGAGQDSALSLFVWVSGMRLLSTGRDRWAGAVFALGLVKPQLFVLVPIVLLAQRRLSALAAWLATAAAIGLVSLTVVGPTAVRDWLAVPFSPLYQEVVQARQAWKMEGVPSFLVSLAPSSLSSVAQLVGIVAAGVLVALFAVTVWRAPRSSVGPVWAFAALTTVVASPHLLSYDLVLAVPALLHLLETHERRSTRLALVLLFVLTWTSQLRHVLADPLPWPLTWVGAAWSTVPLLVLWYLCWCECRELEVSRIPP